MDIEIRPLTPDNRDAWAALWRDYQAFYDVALADTVTETTWRRFFDPAEPLYALGAFDGPELVGIVHFLLHRSTWMIEDTCYLHDLFVPAAQRGKHIGRRLIEGVYGQAERLGARHVYWQTRSSNKAARRLYDSLADHHGFIVYERRY